jgi:hypothetical protein
MRDRLLALCQEAEDVQVAAEYAAGLPWAEGTYQDDIRAKAAYAAETAERARKAIQMAEARIAAAGGAG